MGPIPKGTYAIHTDELSDPNFFVDIGRNFRGDWGDWRVKLHPVIVPESHGRNGFFMHGGKFKGSAGCIDVGGGLWGNRSTDQLKQDILSDVDKKVMIYVYSDAEEMISEKCKINE